MSDSPTSIQDCFAHRKAQGRGVLIPYLTAGYPDAQTTLNKDTFPEDFEFSSGDKIPLMGPGGAHFIGTITEIRDADITVDMNHPMAGKDLNFEIELVEIGGD